MVRILKIGFGQHAIALHLRVAGHALIFLEQLGGIAPLAVVLPVARTRIVAARRSTTAATAPAAAALTIVDQTKILTKGGYSCPYPAGPFPASLSARPGRQGIAKFATPATAPTLLRKR